MAVVPAGLEMDWGCWTNSAGAGWGQRSMRSREGQVERVNTAVSEGKRQGERGQGLRSAGDKVDSQHTRLRKSARCGPGSRRWWQALLPSAPEADPREDSILMTV